MSGDVFKSLKGKTFRNYMELMFDIKALGFESELDLSAVVRAINESTSIFGSGGVYLRTEPSTLPDTQQEILCIHMSSTRGGTLSNIVYLRSDRPGRLCVAENVLGDPSKTLTTRPINRKDLTTDEVVQIMRLVQGSLAPATQKHYAGVEKLLTTIEGASQVRCAIVESPEKFSLMYTVACKPLFNLELHKV